MRLRSRELFQTAHAEGGLLPADLLGRIADGDAGLDGLAPGDYHLAYGERLGEAITRSWTRLTGAWSTFDEARHAMAAGEPGGRLTRERWLHILFDELGYGRLVQQPAIEIEGKPFPVFTQWQHTPIHLVGCGVQIDTRTPGVKGAAGQSPHSLVQELLNRSPERLWGIASNGLMLRVLRDNVALTRQAYLQFDLEAMLIEDVYSDFVLLWLLCHQSRFEADRPEDCWLERWTRTAGQAGTRALDALRQGVQEAIETLGAGFLAHPANHSLHTALRDGALDPHDYYRALLRLVYRLLFLFVAEDRDALLDPAADPLARERYLTHYSTRALRTLAGRRRGGRQPDRYEQLKLIMNCLDSDGCPPLGLPALGSYLWSPAAIGPLATATLANDDLLAAIRSLATVEAGGVRRAVDFRNLGAEELGSVYESLLELHPALHRAAATFALRTAAGSERKTTGSYYTPTSLISALLDSALEPVLDEAARGENPEAAILSLAVVDPACGSGHFLIAAAARIAKRLAAIRSQDPEPSPVQLRVALREVIGHCLYGIDANPMAVELCKVSLWMEALAPGRPLSFLDHRIALGNSLLGATPALIASGIPADAFKPILGDDRKTVSELRKRNAKALAGQLAFDLNASTDADTRALAEQSAAIDAVDDRSLAGVREQPRRFAQLLSSTELRRAGLAADVWCTAFVAEKRPGASPVTQETLGRALDAGVDSLSPDEREVVRRAREQYAFLHWHIAFPAVTERGGFDVVLGNPPWEHTELKEKGFFATRYPAIATASTGATRKRMIEALAAEDPPLFSAFEGAKRQADGFSHFVRSSGRYPLCGRGRINTYAIFAELMRAAIGPAGRAGVIVPTGIATDDTTKHFFQEIIENRSLASLYDFENRGGLFPAVASRMKFCLLTLTGAARAAAEGAAFVFFATATEQLTDPERRFTLSAQDIALLNPNTRTCPVFRSRRDAELTKAIYRRVHVLVREVDPHGNPWGITFKQGLFNMTSDSHLFRTREQLEADGCELHGNVFTRDDERWLPLYEAKMLHHYDHRWATYDGLGIRELTEAEKNDPTCLALPRYSVAESEVDEALPGWRYEWPLAFRNVARSTDERTLVDSLIPRVAVGNSAPVVASSCPSDLSLLATAWSSFPVDYIARQKVGGVNMNFLYMLQLPVPRPEAFSTDFIMSRVFELTYTATDLAAFARDLGYDGPPFRWDPDRRALIRAELDATMFRLYGIERDDVDYIMDTFPIVRRKDEQRFDEYRTKRLILERYDAMVAADAAGFSYETPLDPPPGDPRAAGPPAERAIMPS